MKKPFPLFVSCFLALVIGSVTAVPVFSACPKSILKKRKLIRKQRKQLNEFVESKREKTRTRLIKKLRELIKKARESRQAGQKQRLSYLVDGLARLDREKAKAFRKQVNSLPEIKNNGAGESNENTEWRQTYREYVVDVIEPLRPIVNRAISSQVNWVAYEFLRLILTIDPDNRKVRNALEQKKVNGEWVSSFRYNYYSRGILWDPELGWIRQDQKDRYKEGEYYDFQLKKWGSLSELNELHNSLKNPWTLRTAHLKLVGNVKIQKLAEVANKLEAFYSQIFAVYSRFFSQGQASYKLIFGLRKHPPLEIHMYRDKQDYLNAIPSRVPNWSAGVFISKEEASYFYKGNWSTMYHEFTHHIFHEFTRGRGDAPNWLSEGIAVYTETPKYNEHGDLVLGNPRSSRKLKVFLKRYKNGNHMSVNQLVSLTSGRDWDRAVRSSPPNPYTAAGAVTFFCMDANDQKYRPDFIDYVRDAYQGNVRCDLWEYLGLSKSEFTSKYHSWLDNLLE